MLNVSCGQAEIILLVTYLMTESVYVGSSIQTFIKGGKSPDRVIATPVFEYL